jgi:type II secretory ATPase GspE/PulE/Tfp pilus assembly ATPase PilB-like protein
MGVKPFLVASAVKAVLAQRLVRTICGDCKETYEPRTDELIEMGLNYDDVQDAKFYRGHGCPSCNHTGYRGRLGIFELMDLSEAVQEMILAHKPTSAVREVARQEGMMTLREDGWQKVFRGITTTNEVTRVTQQDAS